MSGNHLAPLASKPTDMLSFDFALVGGGLANGLIALAIRSLQPAARIAMIERGDSPGGNHTWCFHARDVKPEMSAWIDPLIDVRWPGYDVAFRDHERRLDSPYACVTSTSLAAHVSRAVDRCDSRLWTRATATDVTANRVVFTDAEGREHAIEARAVIDARGPDRIAVADRSGWQKFVGRELRLATPHGLDRPLLMDARVEQRDGFRFVYVLPLSARSVLVEDTYFSDGTHLDVADVRAEIARYCARRSWRIEACEREEVGMLPMPLATTPPPTSSPLVAGYAGNWFHPVTAYSFPIAARLAAFIAARPPDRLFGAELDDLAREHGRQLGFCGLLNRMMFLWYPPNERHNVLSRFYRNSAAVIERFYALELSMVDRARIFVGRPPRGLSLRAALGGSR
jgi:lycopene beta-cyclase